MTRLFLTNRLISSGLSVHRNWFFFTFNLRHLPSVANRLGLFCQLLLLPFGYGSSLSNNRFFRNQHFQPMVEEPWHRNPREYNVHREDAYRLPPSPHFDPILHERRLRRWERGHVWRVTRLGKSFLELHIFHPIYIWIIYNRGVWPWQLETYHFPYSSSWEYLPLSVCPSSEYFKRKLKDKRRTPRQFTKSNRFPLLFSFRRPLNISIVLIWLTTLEVELLIWPRHCRIPTYSLKIFW